MWLYDGHVPADSFSIVQEHKQKQNKLPCLLNDIKVSCPKIYCGYLQDTFLIVLPKCGAVNYNQRIFVFRVCRPWSDLKTGTGEGSPELKQNGLPASCRCIRAPGFTDICTIKNNLSLCRTPPPVRSNVLLLLACNTNTQCISELNIRHTMWHRLTFLPRTVFSNKSRFSVSTRRMWVCWGS